MPEPPTAPATRDNTSASSSPAPCVERPQPRWCGVYWGDNPAAPAPPRFHPRLAFQPAMPTLSPIRLQSFARQLLEAGGATADEAQIVAASLVDANLKGYDSHGVMRIPYYVQAIKEDEV